VELHDVGLAFAELITGAVATDRDILRHSSDLTGKGLRLRITWLRLVFMDYPSQPIVRYPIPRSL
jgi:hypothetical protein